MTTVIVCAIVAVIAAFVLGCAVGVKAQRAATEQDLANNIALIDRINSTARDTLATLRGQDCKGGRPAEK